LLADKLLLVAPLLLLQTLIDIKDVKGVEEVAVFKDY
jgi:hypothetical protein